MKNKIISITTRVITTVLSIITALLLILAVYNFFSVKILKKDYSNIFGYTFFEVISGSMSPTIEKWDVILLKLDNEEYEVGDIISYKSDEAYITHRIVEKNGKTYVTKGDFNNTVDNPITEDKIVGKVVKTFSGVGAWIKVITTPRIIFSVVISLALLGYTIKMFKKQEKDIDDKFKLEGSVVMEKIKNSTSLKIKLCILAILLLLLIVLVPYTLSRFKTEARTDVPIDIAFFLVNDTYTHQEITLTDMEPGDINSYTFSVSNTDGENRTEVNMTYEVEVLATTNLPLEYGLYIINSGIDQNFVSSNEVITDDDGTFFRLLKTSTRSFTFDADTTDNYKLTVKFPSEFRNFKYQDVAENIEIRIKAKQVLDGDN
ncbi:MAG: signal peptidase I [Bacilli bacterium]|nr:signal peptidase I [Bacilli bacterium]